jgi:hypothetical protein
MGREPILEASGIEARGGTGQVKVTGQTSPEVALFLRRAGANRYGARAFSTLEGYAGRDRETESALTAKSGKTPGHRPGFRLRWKEGRREAATIGLPCACATVKGGETAAGSSKGLLVADEVGSSRFLGKEFQFADI